VAKELEKSTRLAAGNYHAVEVVEVLRVAHQHDFGAKLLQPMPMRFEITLQSKDPNSHSSVFVISYPVVRLSQTAENPKIVITSNAGQGKKADSSLRS
jgi:hypothetical protein